MSRSLLSALLACALMLAGCGSDGDGGLEPEVEVSPSTVDSPSTSTPESTDSTSSSPTDAPDSTSPPVTAEPVEMPDLVGKTETEARAELLAVGVDQINVQSEETLETPGIVIDQIPGEGRPIAGPVSLVVSEPLGPVPDFQGMNVAEVTDWAAARSVTVTQQEALSDEVPPGTVLSTVPAAGDAAVAEILVSVAVAPYTETLMAFEWLEERGPVDRADAKVNAVTYPRSITIDHSRYNREGSVEIDLSRSWSSFVATIGLRDDASSDAVVRFEVLADGTTIYRESVPFGTEEALRLDVSNVLRLRLITTFEGERNARATAVWGEAAVVGLPPDA